MSVVKPSIPKGTRDFSPEEMVRRNYIFDIIRSVFRLYGYQPLETPSMENLSTLMGKYGEEGDKLLFRILNSGDFLHGLHGRQFQGSGVKVDVDGTGQILPDHRAMAASIAEKGLRYDLTVPFARFVVQHHHDIAFPFKRYQIQPVWRADRPQKGRYREFFQCDADVIGSDSLINEVELIQIIDDIFSRLGIEVTIHLNNRKILAGMAEAIGHSDLLTHITVAIDKLDKTGTEKVAEELVQRGITREAIEKLLPLLKQKGETSEMLQTLSDMFGNSEIGKNGLEEMKILLEFTANLHTRNPVHFDISLARGLSYYTGTIIEVKASDVSMGSICGGGRYDNLTGIFGLPGISGVGISFGADRIYDVMQELQLFPPQLLSSSRLLLLNFGQDEEIHCLGLVKKFREAGIPSEIYPDQVKIKRQMEYANRKNIPWVAFIGQEEMTRGVLTLKNMETGVQQTVTPDETIKLLS